MVQKPNFENNLLGLKLFPDFENKNGQRIYQDAQIPK